MSMKTNSVINWFYPNSFKYSSKTHITLAKACVNRIELYDMSYSLLAIYQSPWDKNVWFETNVVCDKNI